MALTLVSVESGYNVYEDADGDEFLATPLPVVHKLVLWEDFDLQTSWMNAVQYHVKNPSTPWRYRPDRDEFVIQVWREIADHEFVNIAWCASCEDPHRGDSVTPVNGGTEHACESCYDEYYRPCEDCDDVVYYDDMQYVADDHSVCESCRDRNYTYCEDCDGYYHESDSAEHTHGGCDCEPPTSSVTMRREGDTVLTENERVTVSLPAGVISEEGLGLIFRLVRDYAYTLDAEDYTTRSKWWDLAYAVHGMDTRWQTKEGNFTKRLSKLAHKLHGLKFPPELLTKVGNIARENSNGTDIQVELTRDLNLPAEEFYHAESCWWQSYSNSRCALKSNGGIGMRTFSHYGSVEGRAWIMPLRLSEDDFLRPTFDSLTADAYVVFNGYGDLSGYTPARVVAGMAGMTYRKIDFNCSPMYVNGTSGYLVASEEIASKYAESGLDLYVETHSHLFYSEQARTLVAA